MQNNKTEEERDKEDPVQAEVRMPEPEGAAAVGKEGGDIPEGIAGSSQGRRTLGIGSNSRNVLEEILQKG